jgi:hypothetical protein
VREASREVGFNRRHPERGRALALTPLVTGRVEEIREATAWAEPEALTTVFRELLRLAAAAGELKSGAGMNAARTMLAEAARLRERGPPPPPARSQPNPVASAPTLPDLTTEEWIAAFGPIR